MIYCLWFAISFAVLFVSSVWSLCKRLAKDRDRNTLSPMQTFTVGVAISVLLMFVPVYYDNYQLGDAWGYVRPLLLALHNTFRVFILDGEFDVVRNALLGGAPGAELSTAVVAAPLDQEWLRVLLSTYGILLYVMAPVLTFTAVLSLFKNMVARIRLKGNWMRTYYIMSELNERSMALAESIQRQNRGRARVVFTDVFEHNEEADYELLARAGKIRAICLKQDVTNVILDRSRPVEYFLIGENESENISQATKIVEEFKQRPKRRHISVFVFATSPESESMVDSIAAGVPDDKLHLPDGQGSAALSVAGVRFRAFWLKPASVLIRRIDPVEKLVWNELRAMDVFGRADKEKTIPILLVGMGKHGRAFFKNLIWACQASGYRLELNVVDKRKPGEHGSIRSVLESQCPELIELNGQEVDGEACYSIEFFEGIDVESGEFSDLLDYRGSDPETMRRSQRLRKTAIAVVAMGEDDKNIRVAMDLRMHFDRLLDIRATEKQMLREEQAAIYAVVYDEQKTAILTSGESTNHLLNYKSVPYNIHFIGNMAVQYDYKRIYEPVLERRAYKFHTLWAIQDHRAWNELQELLEKTEKAAVSSYPADLKIPKKEKPEGEEYVEDPEEKKRDTDRLMYGRFEYYRKSSMARVIHQEAMDKSFAALYERKKKHDQICFCDDCTWAKKTEHMRWNAYMRALGYRRGAGHFSRAKLHGNLIPWSELSWQDRIKD